MKKFKIFRLLLGLPGKRRSLGMIGVWTLRSNTGGRVACTELSEARQATVFTDVYLPSFTANSRFMIRKSKAFFGATLDGIREFPLHIRKELVRLKLRRRGSFEDSTWISLFLRPILEWQKGRQLLGTPLVAAMLVGAIASPLADPAQNLFNQTNEVMTVQIDPASTLTTEEGRYAFLPVEELTGVSQEFHSGHPGMDLRAPIGSNVLVMESGTVSKIIESKFGYGRHVYVEHKNGLITLYAHLGLIGVEEGEELTAGEKVGEIGMSGWSTGPHLHFEVYQGDKQVNPRLYLQKALVSGR